jgi:cation diffusion facilitator family transporter
MNTSKAVKVSVISIIVNMALSLGKFIVGFSGNSTALISDAVHSASDVFSTFIVIIGVVISGKGADREHPYGHERMECIAAVILAAALGATGAGIGYNGIMTIYSGAYNEMKIPSAAALITAVISIIVKELMYQFTKITAKQINSDALMADAWHHRSDALSSVGSFAGIGGAMLGYPIFDSIAAIIICIFILKAAVDIAVDSVNKLVDKSCGDEIEKNISDIILAQNGVMALEDIKTRMFGAKIYVDIIIAVNGNLTLYEAHDIAELVHDEVEKNFENVKHCMVHVNPYENK